MALEYYHLIRWSGQLFEAIMADIKSVLNADGPLARIDHFGFKSKGHSHFKRLLVKSLGNVGILIYFDTKAVPYKCYL